MRRRGYLWRLLAGLACAAAFAGCHKSASDVCMKGCERTFSCLGGTTANIRDCQNNCAAKDSNPDNCTIDSYNDANDCAWDCYNEVSCSDLPKCLINCPKCIKQN